MPRVIPGHGFVQTSSPTSPRTGLPSGPKTSTAIPSAGPPSEHAFSGWTTAGDRKHAPTSVPPEKLMTGQRPPPTTRENHRYGSVFHGSPVEPSTRRDDRSCFVTCSSPSGASARTSVGDTPRMLMRWRSTMSHSRSGAGMVRRTVVEEDRAAERERPDDHPRAP